MGKRKREVKDDASRPGNGSHKNSAGNPQHANKKSSIGSETIQIITGSYDRVLHGFTATFDLSSVAVNDNDVQSEVFFADTFMFNAHTSAVRCLALSPLTSKAEDAPSKLMLATGGSDERINLYSLSGNAPSARAKDVAALPSLSSVARQENPKNRELGTLIHHSSNITQLYFAGRSKLLSSSEDNTIAVSRTRDWTMLTTLKPPMPKILGRPSGDTAPPGGAPAGVNDFAIHPSKMLAISVGKGERTMRLWNLVRGLKGEVHDFERDLLRAVGETKHSTGEARSVLFSPDETSFVVSFDRGAVVYRLPFHLQGLVLTKSRTKLHKMRFLPNDLSNVLAVSTDDGRVLFFDTQKLTSASDGAAEIYKSCKLLGQLGGPTEGVATRIKSFEVIQSANDSRALAIVTASSDGSIRIWHLNATSLVGSKPSSDASTEGSATSDNHDELEVDSGVVPEATRQLGRLLGRYDTANRITCMEAFRMLPSVDDIEPLNGTSGKAYENPKKTQTVQKPSKKAGVMKSAIDYASHGDEAKEEDFVGFD